MKFDAMIFISWLMIAICVVSMIGLIVTNIPTGG